MQCCQVFCKAQQQYYDINLIQRKNTINSNPTVVYLLPFMKKSILLIQIGHVNEHPIIHYFGIPRHTQSMIVHKIVVEYFWKTQQKTALWECCYHTLLQSLHIFIFLEVCIVFIPVNNEYHSSHCYPSQPVMALDCLYQVTRR